MKINSSGKKQITKIIKQVKFEKIKWINLFFCIFVRFRATRFICFPSASRILFGFLRAFSRDIIQILVTKLNNNS